MLPNINASLTNTNIIGQTLEELVTNSSDSLDNPNFTFDKLPDLTLERLYDHSKESDSRLSFINNFFLIEPKQTESKVEATKVETVKRLNSVASKKGKKLYTAEQKKQLAIECVASGGLAKFSRDYDIPLSTLRGWVNIYIPDYQSSRQRQMKVAKKKEKQSGNDKREKNRVVEEEKSENLVENEKRKAVKTNEFLKKLMK